MKTICVNGMTVKVVRKRVRRMILHAAPEGPWLSMPLRATKEQALQFVTAQHDWLQQQQSRLQENTDASGFSDGETVFLWGQAYMLRVQEGAAKPGAQHAGDGAVLLRVPEDSDLALRQRLLDDWYRRELQAALESAMEKWQRIVGRKASDCRVRLMKTRWGSCTVHTGSIRINLRLAQKPPECLDYVVVHELTHLHVPNHSAAFWKLMDRFYPAWRTVRAELNARKKR